MLSQHQQTEGSALAYPRQPVVGPAEAVASPQREPLKTPEAARYLGMSESWLRQSRMDGQMSQPPPWHVIGNRAVRYFRHELDGWLARRAPSGDQCKPAPQIATVAPEAERAVPKARKGRKTVAKRRGTATAPPKGRRQARRPS